MSASKAGAERAARAEMADEEREINRFPRLRSGSCNQQTRPLKSSPCSDGMGVSFPADGMLIGWSVSGWILR